MEKIEKGRKGDEIEVDCGGFLCRKKKKPKELSERIIFPKQIHSFNSTDILYNLEYSY